MNRMTVVIAVIAVFVILGLLGLVGCGGATRPDGGEGLLPVGSAVPKLSGVDQMGNPHTLDEVLGSVALIYFYPKDQTPGCTKEACAFRDVWSKYEAAGIKLFGVSKGTQESHKEFSDKHSLPFPLIADADMVWGTAFGVGSAMGMYKRVSFLIDKEGKVAKTYENVDPGLHAAQVLQDAAALTP